MDWFVVVCTGRWSAPCSHRSEHRRFHLLHGLAWNRSVLISAKRKPSVFDEIGQCEVVACLAGALAVASLDDTGRFCLVVKTGLRQRLNLWVFQLGPGSDPYLHGEETSGFPATGRPFVSDWNLVGTDAASLAEDAHGRTKEKDKSLSFVVGS